MSAAPTPAVPGLWRVVGRRVDADDVATLFVRPLDGEPPAFEPAQFSMIGVPGVGEIPISMSTPTRERDAHGYTIRRSGAVSDRLVGLDVGDVVTVRGPFGHPWQLQRAAGRHAVFVAGGIGIAPLRAAIHELLAGQPTVAGVVVLAGAIDPSRFVFREWFDELASTGVDVRLAVDRVDHGSWDGHVGVVTGLLPAVVGEVGDPGCVAAFVCGPDAMMAATVSELGRLGVPGEQIQVTLERNMHCGVGWCGHCQLGPLLVCRDGPVLDAVALGDLLTIGEL